MKCTPYTTYIYSTSGAAVGFNCGPAVGSVIRFQILRRSLLHTSRINLNLTWPPGMLRVSLRGGNMKKHLNHDHMVAGWPLNNSSSVLSCNDSSMNYLSSFSCSLSVHRAAARLRQPSKYDSMGVVYVTGRCGLRVHTYGLTSVFSLFLK